MSYLIPHMPQEVIWDILPADHYWPEMLRFYCQTSIPTDPALSFMANMWSYALANGELSGTHAITAKAFIETRMAELPWEKLRYFYSYDRAPLGKPMR